MNSNTGYTPNSHAEKQSYTEHTPLSHAPSSNLVFFDSDNKSIFDIPGESDANRRSNFKRFEVSNSFDIYGNDLTPQSRESSQFYQEDDEFWRDKEEKKPVKGMKVNEENINPWEHMVTPMKNRTAGALQSKDSLRASRSPLLNITPMPKKAIEENNRKIERVLLYNTTPGEKNTMKDKKTTTILKSLR